MSSFGFAALRILFPLCATISLSYAQNTSNSTSIDTSHSTTDTQCPINEPGFVHNGDCHLLCGPPTWVEILTFFFANYVAHAATVLTSPGQTKMASIFYIVGALLLPVIGITRGMRAVGTLAVFAKTDLQRAVRAGALCAVIKNKPVSEGDIESFRNGDMELSPLNERSIANNGPLILAPRQGIPLFKYAQSPESIEQLKYMKSAGYHLEIVEDGPAVFEHDDDIDERKRVYLAANYNILAILAALLQLGSAITTLLKKRGDQIALYGVGAPAITVIPYAWVSLINLLGNISCPSYDAMYLVESVDLDALRIALRDAGELASKQFVVEGTVGRLQPAAGGNSNTLDPKDAHIRDSLEMRLGIEDHISGSFLLLIIVTGTTAFPFILFFAILLKVRPSTTKLTTFQLTAVALWNLFPVIFVILGLLGKSLSLLNANKPDSKYRSKGKKVIDIIGTVFGIIVLFVPTTLMFVSVGQILVKIGSCMYIREELMV